MLKLNFEKSPNGLIPAIVQDHRSNTVLMLAYVNCQAWEETLKTGKAHFWSRSRNQLWLKGESSGNVQFIKDILIDCDEDTIIYKVEQVGNAACHKGYFSCFFRKEEHGDLVTIANRVFDPKDVYK
ncbi:MAG: phosphoribosyl-AMP cyclohydrolase [Desulfobacterales bacterium]|nr:phosphoribosyl-AMP cyclohydrolase [Deltaproteobacteria bacterium]NNK96707.1 phosphoribosyl-AMP cyclohydrolase [Desulfobacterales bacterium]